MGDQPGFYHADHLGSSMKAAGGAMQGCGAEERALRMYYATKDSANGRDASFQRVSDQAQGGANLQAEAAFHLLFGQQLALQQQQASAPMPIDHSLYQQQHQQQQVQRGGVISSPSDSLWAPTGSPHDSFIAAYSPDNNHTPARSLQSLASGESAGGGHSGRLPAPGTSHGSSGAHDGDRDRDLFGRVISPHTPPARTSQGSFHGFGDHTINTTTNTSSRHLGSQPAGAGQYGAIGQDVQGLAVGHMSGGTPSWGSTECGPQAEGGMGRTAGSFTHGGMGGQQSTVHAQHDAHHLHSAASLQAAMDVLDQRHIAATQAAAAAAAATTQGPDLSGLLGGGLSTPQQMQAALQQVMMQQMQQQAAAAAAASMLNPFGPQPGLSAMSAMQQVQQQAAAAAAAACMFPGMGSFPGMAGMAGFPGMFPGMPVPAFPGAMPFMPPAAFGMGAAQMPGAGAFGLMPQFPGAPDFSQYHAKMAEAQAAAMAVLMAGAGGGGGGGAAKEQRNSGTGSAGDGRRSDSPVRDGGSNGRREGCGVASNWRDGRGGGGGRDDERMDLDRAGSFSRGGSIGSGGSGDRDRQWDGGRDSRGSGGQGQGQGQVHYDRQDVRGGSDAGRRNERDWRDDWLDDPLLEEFKLNKNRKFEFKDVCGHVCAFSVDQHGSRFIQQKLEFISPKELTWALAEVLPHCLRLMYDVFGNYVMQKFFEHGSPAQRSRLADEVRGNVLQLSLGVYSCRVVQKALETAVPDRQLDLFSELDHHVMRCVRDQNGNHVIQKALEVLPAPRLARLIDSFLPVVVPLATHPFGCRVIQRLLEHCKDDARRQAVMDIVLKSSYQLAQDQYGNYVMQHVIEHGNAEERWQVVVRLEQQVVALAQHKFASNVVEKCLVHCVPRGRDTLIERMLLGGADGQGGGDGFGGQGGGEDPLQQMMKDQYGNYVVQRVLEVCNDQQREALLSRVRTQLHALKRYTYGKHIVARVEKLLSTGTKLQTSAKNRALPDDRTLALSGFLPLGRAAPSEAPPALPAAAFDDAALALPFSAVKAEAQEPFADILSAETSQSEVVDAVGVETELAVSPPPEVSA